MTTGPTTSGPTITVRTGHPDFLDLPWGESVVDWTTPRLVALPKGISRHEVRFVRYAHGLYAVKELPAGAARNDYEILRALERADAPAVTPVGLVEHRYPDAGAERSAALITRYADFSFSYRELLEGAGFGERRRQMLGAFAGLLVELHLAGCFWGDCSLSNVLYRWDAMTIEPMMVDAETARIYPSLSDGQRMHDIDIMITNVTGGMCDIAAASGHDAADADFQLGPEIAEWYHWLWDESTHEDVIPGDERAAIEARVHRLNDLGFTVDHVDLTPIADGSAVRVRPVVGARNFSARRLREMAGIDASEWQARTLLGDLEDYASAKGLDAEHDRALAAALWRFDRLDPALRLVAELAPDRDAVQGYCDLIRFVHLETAHGVPDDDRDAAAHRWAAAGRPGFTPSDDPRSRPERA